MTRPTTRRVAAVLQTVRPDAGEVSTMLLSGGTTSLSKLIPRTHNDYVLNARLCAQAAGFDSDTVFLAVLPLAHNYNLASPGMLGDLLRRRHRGHRDQHRHRRRSSGPSSASG